MASSFLSVRKQLEREAKKVKSKIVARKKENPAWQSYVLEEIRQEVVKALQKALADKILAQRLELQLPPSHIKGDLALTIFNLSKKHKAPLEILADKICRRLNSQPSAFIKGASKIGVFVNIELDKENLYRQVIFQAAKLAQNYGHSNFYDKLLAVIEYSSPNIAKPISVGHLRSTIIGQALANIYQAAGFYVIRENYLGDWGSQFGKLLYAYQIWGNADKIAKNPIAELKNLYVKFHAKEQQDPEISPKAAQLARRLEKGEAKIVELWRKFRDLSISDFKKTYELLGADFDIYTGESYFVKDGKEIIEDCLEKGICQKAQDSKLVKVESLENVPSFLLRKADGSTLYLTRELGLLRFRVKVFKPQTILYVVGQEQELHFKQLLALAKKLGYLPENIKAEHVKFGLVLAEGKKMATRKGTAIELEELILKAVEKASQIIKEKNPGIAEKEAQEIAKIVGIGAIIYNDLKQNREHNVSFDWGKMLNLEAGSAPYLQYTAVRIKSVLKNVEKKLGKIKPLTAEKLTFKHPSEFALARKIMFFPQVILTCQRTCQPHHLCTYLEELAQLFNVFYSQVSVIKTPDPILQASRIMLISAVLQVLQNGLSLLNIKIPEKM